MDRRNVEALFSSWNTPMVRACLQGHMGRIVTWGENSAMAVLGDFCFLAGEPVSELVERADAPILVPGDSRWVQLIQSVLGERAVRFTRYATRHAPEQFNRRRLYTFTSTVPQGFLIKQIDKELYLTLMEEEWARDLGGNFAGAADFLERGLGFAVLMKGLLVAGASSYAVCDGAIEIEIDTRPDFRQQGLATACGARLILECQARGIYPSWDAHDERSLALAKKLGYQLDRPYTAFWVEEKRREYFSRESEN